MGTIPTSYVYQDEQKLDLDGHNKNIYSVGGLNEGIMSTANGALEASNLDTNFRVQPEHVQTEEALRLRQDYATDEVDLFEDAFAKSEEYTYTIANAPDNLWRGVPGAAVRLYLPYTVSAAVWQWSFFINPFRCKVTKMDGTFSAPEVAVAVKLDGSIIAHTKRSIPTVHTYGQNLDSSGVPVVSTSNNGWSGYISGQACQWYDMSHMTTNTAAGWHDLQLCVYMETTGTVTGVGGNARADGSSTALNLRRNNASSLFHNNIVNQRLSFGVRNARVITIL